MNSKEFAKLIGVSQSTVSRALNNSNLVPEERRKFIHDKAKELGFALNSQARSLKTRKTGTIGILFPKHFVSMNANLMLAHLYDVIQKEMHNYDYDIMVIYYNTAGDDFSSFERIIRKRKVDGFIVLRMELTSREMDLIEQYNVPCVFMMNAGTKVRDNLNYLFSDSAYGGQLAGQFFGAFRTFNKFFITIKEEREDAERRLSGYRKGLLKHGYKLSDKNILFCNLDIASAYHCIIEHKEMFVGHKTAIFSYSDIVGIGALNACKDLGLTIPEDVQLIGMDDIMLAAVNRPSLSTLHIPVDCMVSRGCKLLIQLINKKDVLVQEWLKPNLILRESTINV